MATNSDAEKLRKQIEVLSSLIDTQRELKKKDNSTNKQQSIVKYSWQKASPDNKNSSRNELSHKGQNKNSGNSFTLDRRKDESGEFSAKTSALNPLSRTGGTRTYENNNSYKKNEQIIPLFKPSVSSDISLPTTRLVLAKVDKDTKNLKIVEKNGDKTKRKVPDKPRSETSKDKNEKNLAASKSLLSARLSSLSSSIAAAKSKLNFESSAVSNTGSKKSTKVLSTISNSSSNVLMKSSSSSLHTKKKSCPSSSSFSWSKQQTSVPGTSSLSNRNKPSTSSLKWTKSGTNKSRSELRNKPLNAARVLVKPTHGSTHVWRSRQTLKLDRRKRKSITLENKGFMRRRQKGVVKDLPKKAVHISRYSLVNSKRKNPIKAEKSNKVVIIEGIPYKSSANKLQKASQYKTGTNPKKVTSKRRTSMTLNIRGEKFLMDVSGKTLTRINSGKTPKGKGPATETSTGTALNTGGSKGKRRLSVSKVSIGGVTFVQTEPGVLVRSSDAVNQKIASRVVRRSVQNAILFKYKKKAKPKSQQYCMFYNRFGKCNKGENCPYIHDPTKIAVCTKFLQGKCKKTDGTCSFSHKLDKDKMPVCQFFLKGNCNNDNCPYSHVNVSSNAAVCQDFIKGYCLNGQQCKKKHILDCEEFSRTGKCSRGKKCNLIHWKRKANKRRKSSASRDPEPKRAALEQMTEEDGFLPLEKIDVSTDKDSSHLDDVTHKPPAEPIVIKPRFLINKDKPG